jgi:hypothetical protein
MEAWTFSTSPLWTVREVVVSTLLHRELRTAARRRCIRVSRQHHGTARVGGGFLSHATRASPRKMLTQERRVRLRILHESAETRKPRDGCRGKRTPYSTLLSSVYSTPHESHETADLPMPLLRLSIRCWVGGMGMLQSPHDFFTFSLCQESKGVLVTAIVLRGGG